MSGLGEPFGALLLAIVTTVVILVLASFVLLRALRGSQPLSHPWLLRGVWIGLVALLAIAVNLVSQTWTRALPADRAQPVQVVQVEASMWRFALDRPTLPLGVPLEFRVTSRDTVHGFGVYDPDGRLLFTVMAVPGHTERALYTFTRSGEYTLRCTEYCGAPHGLMRGTFTVEGG